MSNYNFCQLLFSGSVLTTKNNKEMNVINLNELNFVDNGEMRSFLKNKSGIYFWINLLDYKIYIGSSVALWRRFLSYKNCFLDKKNKRNNIRLKRAVAKYGLENFRFGIIEILNNDKKLLKDHEQIVLDDIQPFAKNGYNISKSAHRPMNFVMPKQSRLNTTLSCTGENSQTAKLNNQKVIIIKTKLSQGVELRVLAEEFGVSTTVISNIKRCKSWAHVKVDEITENILKEQTLRDKHKLSEDFVKLIKTELRDGMRSFEIALKYNLIYSTVHSIKNGHIYSYITID